MSGQPAYTYATLPAPASSYVGQPDLLTTDQGYCYCNGTQWIPRGQQRLLGPLVGSLNSTSGTVQIGETAYTSDQKLVTWNGVSWNTPVPRPLFVGGIGDSITAVNMPNLNLQTSTAAQTYANIAKYFGPQSWMMYGAARSGGAWAPFEYISGFPGATSASVLATCVPALLNYPYGQPDAVEILVGTNDIGQSVPITTIIQNIKLIATAMNGAGISPMLATILPTSTNQAQAQRLNQAIMRLAKEMKLPVTDYYSALVSPTGGWASANWNTLDNVHPSNQGAAIMGYLLNQTIQQAFGLNSQRLNTALYASGLNTQNTDPMLQTFTGTINTASSYPTGNGWGTPGTPSMCTVFNSSGTEPGTAGTHTMFAATPQILGGSGTPNYLGNAFSISGNGTNSFGIYGPTCGVSAAVGDRIQVRFRIKWIPNTGGATADQFSVQAVQNGTVCAGWVNSNTQIAAGAPIGNESGYYAGDFYQEYVVPAGYAGTSEFFVSTPGTLNTGASLTLANMSIVNLTQAGIVNP